MDKFLVSRFLVLVESLNRLNPTLPEAAIQDALYKLHNFENGSLIQKNTVFMNYLQNGIEYEFDEDDNFAWQQSWITMSKSIGNPERVAALTMALNEDGSFEAQCGLRKHPKMFVEQMSNRGWWASDGSFSRGKVWLSEDDGAIKVVSFYHWDPIQSFLELLSQY